MRILAIETSCDETSIAVLEADAARLRLRRHIISSQIDLHRAFGGVVPEVAARRHLELLQPLLERGVGRAGLSSVDAIAVTAGPGLITSLMVGMQTAKALSYVWRKPLIAVDHLEGHIYANWLSHPTLVTGGNRYFPALVLIVSGGHTQLVAMARHGSYKLLGQTLDDAAGESFDKVANLLNLGYPGGPALSRLASKGNPTAVIFPRPLLKSDDYNFSFSGLKTAVRYYLEKQKKISRRRLPDISASFQQAVVDVLAAKTLKAVRSIRPKSLMLAGGVSANEALRSRFSDIGRDEGISVFVPALKFTGDNAAMIATAAFYRRSQAKTNGWREAAFYTSQRLTAR